MVASPVPKQTGGFRSYSPLAGIRQVSPLVDLPAYSIDDRLEVVLLVFCSQLLCFLIEHQRGLLLGSSPSSPGLGDRCDEIGWPACPDNLLGRLSVCVQFPMTVGFLVRRVEDRSLEKKITQTVTLLGSNSWYDILRSGRQKSDSVLSVALGRIRRRGTIVKRSGLRICSGSGIFCFQPPNTPRAYCALGLFSRHTICPPPAVHSYPDPLAPGCPI